MISVNDASHVENTNKKLDPHSPVICNTDTQSHTHIIRHQTIDFPAESAHLPVERDGEELTLNHMALLISLHSFMACCCKRHVLTGECLI